eukprot:11574883-Alexandrium_andersonii.AAC.1
MRPRKRLRRQQDTQIQCKERAPRHLQARAAAPLVHRRRARRAHPRRVRALHSHRAAIAIQPEPGLRGGR